MSADDPRYALVADALPPVLPPIARQEAERAARCLHRRFGLMTLGGPRMHARAEFDGRVRRCWVSPKPTTGHLKGWGRLVHDVAHRIFRARHPTFAPHAGGHARLERELAEHVVACGWLAGTLRVPPAPRPTRADKLARTDAAIARWETKHRRAANALRKLARRRAALLRPQA